MPTEVWSRPCSAIKLLPLAVEAGGGEGHLHRVSDGDRQLVGDDKINPANALPKVAIDPLRRLLGGTQLVDSPDERRSLVDSPDELGCHYSIS